MNLTEFLPWLSVLLALAVTIGGLLAMRQGYVKQAAELQDRVIDALKTQNEAQEKQITACKLEIVRLKSIVTTMQRTLKRRGLLIEIVGEEISITEESARRTHTVQIKMTDDLEEPKKQLLSGADEQEE